MYAAALAYRVLFSLFPFLILLTSLPLMLVVSIVYHAAPNVKQRHRASASPAATQRESLGRGPDSRHVR